jgi:lipopolysaccharide transport system permease protein
MRQSLTAFNPHASHSSSFLHLLKSLRLNRRLIMQMIIREVLGRYKGSFFGLAWSFFNPILMLVVYSFVFSVVFKSRWGGSEDKLLFALVLFVGLIVLNLFNEVLNRAPSLIISNVNYVKKVVFPLEILPVVSIFSALFHSLVSFIVLIVAILAINGFLHWTVVLTPLVFFPLILITLGFTWFFAAIGVYLRDVSQTIGIITTVLMFLSPVFYPISAVPEQFRTFILANPLTFIIEQAREVIIWGNLPDFIGLGIYMIISIIVFWAGFAIFQMTRKGFSDVL